MLLEFSEETKKNGFFQMIWSFAFFGMIQDEAQVQYNVSSCSPLVVRETKITS